MNNKKNFMPVKYTIDNIHEVLCQTVESGYDIETQGSSLFCRVTLKALKVLRLYEFWDIVKVKEDYRGELWFEIVFANNNKTYMYNRLKRNEVFADNVEDFLLKYGKPDRFKDIWEKYPKSKESHIKKREADLKRVGYTCLSIFEGINEETPVVYYGRKGDDDDNENKNTEH